MLRVRVLIVLALIAHTSVFAQQKTENVILITLDGFRWQELFQGADSAILFNDKEYIKDKSVRVDFWDSSEHVRRQKLMLSFGKQFQSKASSTETGSIIIELIVRIRIGSRIPATANCWLDLWKEKSARMTRL